MSFPAYVHCYVLTATRQFVVSTDDVGCRLFDDVVDKDVVDFCDDVTGT